MSMDPKDMPDLRDSHQLQPLEVHMQTSDLTPRSEPSEPPMRTNTNVSVRTSRVTTANTINDKESVTSEARKSSRGSFIALEESIRSDDEVNPVRKALKVGLKSSLMESLLGVVIVFNFWLICLETDSRAYSPTRGEGVDPPAWVSTSSLVCWILFFCEFLARVYAEQRKFCHSLWNVMDAVIVFMGAGEYLLFATGVDLKGVSVVRVVRLCRLLRLARVMRLFSILKELRRLLQMMGGCFKTLFWSCLLLLFVMTIWAIVAVELVNDYVQDLAEIGIWADCDRCRRSFSSVFMADITFFQTVVAGDSWGYMAIPVIEAHPWTALIFVGALMTLVFGVLNLIVAVIVDTFAENREKDVFQKAKDLEVEEVEQKKVLTRIFNKIDEDRSGSISFPELKRAASKLAEFRHWLRVMDIDERDLENLFKIIDEDQSNAIEEDEFIEAMYRMRNTDSRTATKFVKHMVTRIGAEQTCFKADLAAKIDTLVSADDEIRLKLRKHEERLQTSIELALAKATEVALEAAIRAATACFTGAGPGPGPMSFKLQPPISAISEQVVSLAPKPTGTTTGTGTAGTGTATTTTGSAREGGQEGRTASPSRHGGLSSNPISDSQEGSTIDDDDDYRSTNNSRGTGRRKSGHMWNKRPPPRQPVVSASGGDSMERTPQVEISGMVV